VIFLQLVHVNYKRNKLQKNKVFCSVIFLNLRLHYRPWPWLSGLGLQLDTAGLVNIPAGRTSVDVDASANLELVDKFGYLGDTLSVDGDADAAVEARI